jgi:hypothetical protein
MAAVLCNGIGNMMRALCTGIEKVMCLPCKACGFGCDMISDIFTSPFFLYIAVALGCNIPPIVWAFKSNANYQDYGDQDCGEGLRWLMINSAFCAVNILAAFYVAKRVQEQSQDENLLASGGNVFQENEEGKAGSMNRITHLMCYDKGMALYLIAVIGFVIWQSLGIKEIFALANDTCNLRINVVNSLICAYIFLALAAVSFVCSVCCMKVTGLPR